MPLDINLAPSQYMPTVKRRRGGRRGLGLNPTCWWGKTLNLFQLKCSVADPALYLREQRVQTGTLQYYTSFLHPSFVTFLSSICPRCGPVLPIYFTWTPTRTPAPTSLSIGFIKPVCPAEPHARLPARISCQTRLQNGKLYFTLTGAEFTTCFTKRTQIRGLSPTQEKTMGPLLIWPVILITAQVCMIELMLAPDRMWREK